MVCEICRLRALGCLADRYPALRTHHHDGSETGTSCDIRRRQGEEHGAHHEPAPRRRCFHLRCLIVRLGPPARKITARKAELGADLTVIAVRIPLYLGCRGRLRYVHGEEPARCGRGQKPGRQPGIVSYHLPPPRPPPLSTGGGQCSAKGERPAESLWSSSSTTCW